MVVVIKAPETEPMLGAACSGDLDCSSNNESNSCREQAYSLHTSTMQSAPLEISSLQTGLNLLTTAIELQDATLVTRCCDYLKTQLRKENVLMVYSFLQKCQMPESDPNSFEPSAPPMEENNIHGTNWVTNLTDDSRNACLVLIDAHADYILKQKEIFALSYKGIYDIVTRDTLQASSERVIFNVVYDWGMQECARMTLGKRHLPEVLRQLPYAPRYGLMSKKEFKNQMLEILDEKDWRHIKFYLEETSKGRAVNELPYKMSRPRLAVKGRTNSRSETHDKCDKFLLNVLACWTAVFD